jgi:hypothetical protein
MYLPTVKTRNLYRGVMTNDITYSSLLSCSSGMYIFRGNLQRMTMFMLYTALAFVATMAVLAIYKGW